MSVQSRLNHSVKALRAVKDPRQVHNLVDASNVVAPRLKCSRGFDVSYETAGGLHRARRRCRRDAWVYLLREVALLDEVLYSRQA